MGYTGLTGDSFKKRWTQHNGDFRHNRKTTTLSTYISKLKEEGKQFTVKWEIMDRAPVFNPVTRKCRLCLKEIFYILFRPDSASLNRRNELFNTCRYRTLVKTPKLATVHLLLTSVVTFPYETSL